MKKLSFAIALLLSSSCASSQDFINFVNQSTISPIPVDVSQPIWLDENSVLNASCLIDPTTLTCVGVTVSQPSNKATVETFEFTSGGVISNSGHTIRVRETDPGSVRVSWTSSNSPDICVASSNPVESNWNGAESFNGSRSISVVSGDDSSAFQELLHLGCYNDDGSDGTKTITVNVDERIPLAPIGCNIVKNDIQDHVQRGLFKPNGYTELRPSWYSAFNMNDYPSSWGAHYPIGQWTFGGASMLGKYISIPFTADVAPQHKLEWIPAVAIAQLGEYRPRPATLVYVTISNCSGDFRTTTSISAPEEDPSLRIGCRKADDTGSMFFGQRVNISTCPTVAGQQYFLNIIFADPRDGDLLPNESTCDQAHIFYEPGKCDTEMLMRN